MAAFEAAIALGCHCIEFDVRLTSDGRAVLSHDDIPRGDDGPRSVSRLRMDQIADARLVGPDTILELVRGRIGAHVDLQVRGGEVAVVAQIVEALGTEDLIITTAEDSSVHEILRWSRLRAPGLLVGLSPSPRAAGPHRWSRWIASVESSFPRLRIHLSGADLVVSHRTVARLSLRSYARRRGLPLLVVTVDDPA